VKNEHEIWISSKPFFQLSGKTVSQETSYTARRQAGLPYFCFSVFLFLWAYGLPYFQKARITVLHISILLEMRIQMSIMSIALLPLTHAASLTR
jgi:hypothetical protein